MIGLETIQILQYFYFVTMVVEQKTALKSLNVLKYTAFGGYSDYELFYTGITEEADTLTLSTVNKNFVFIVDFAW